MNSKCALTLQKCALPKVPGHCWLRLGSSAISMVCPDVCPEKSRLRRECARRGGVPSGPILRYIQVLQVIYMIVYVCIFDRVVRIGSPRRPAHTRARAAWGSHTREAPPMPAPGAPTRRCRWVCLLVVACSSASAAAPRPNIVAVVRAGRRPPPAARPCRRRAGATLQLALTCSRKLPPNLTASIFAVAGYSWRMTWGFTTRLCTIRRPRPRTCSS